MKRRTRHDYTDTFLSSAESSRIRTEALVAGIRGGRIWSTPVFRAVPQRIYSAGRPDCVQGWACCVEAVRSDIPSLLVVEGTKVVYEKFLEALDAGEEGAVL